MDGKRGWPLMLSGALAGMAAYLVWDGCWFSFFNGLVGGDLSASGYGSVFLAAAGVLGLLSGLGIGGSIWIMRYFRGRGGKTPGLIGLILSCALFLIGLAGFWFCLRMFAVGQ